MTLVKRSRDELDWPTWFGRRLFDWPESLKDALETTSLRVEEFEENGQLVVRAEMPGIDPDKDVEITVSDGMLCIEAERREEEKTEEKGFVRHELSYGSFTRTLPLPDGVTESDITASYKDGILEIRIPAPEPAPATKISISKS